MIVYFLMNLLTLILCVWVGVSVMTALGLITHDRKNWAWYMVMAWGWPWYLLQGYLFAREVDLS